MADGRRRALALGEVRRPSRAMRLGRAPGTGFSWPRAQRGAARSARKHENPRDPCLCLPCATETFRLYAELETDRNNGLKMLNALADAGLLRLLSSEIGFGNRIPLWLFGFLG